MENGQKMFRNTIEKERQEDEVKEEKEPETHKSDVKE